VNNEWKYTWKGAVVAYLRYFYGTSLEIMKAQILRIAPVPS